MPGDAGVPVRVRTRTAVAGALLLIPALLIGWTGWGWPGWLDGAAGVAFGGVLVAVLVAGAAMLLRRAVLWTRAAALAARLTSGAPSPPVDAPASGQAPHATVGPSVPLHATRPGAPLRRRLPAQVLPIRAASGPLGRGRAVTVHMRSDSLLPRPGDSIAVHVLGTRGPFLLRRDSDGAIFAADSWLFSAL